MPGAAHLELRYSLCAAGCSGNILPPWAECELFKMNDAFSSNLVLMPWMLVKTVTSLPLTMVFFSANVQKVT